MRIIKKSSWHYRFNRAVRGYWWTNDVNTICQYFWTTFFSFVYAIFAIVFVVVIVFALGVAFYEENILNHTIKLYQLKPVEFLWVFLCGLLSWAMIFVFFIAFAYVVNKWNDFFKNYRKNHPKKHKETRAHCELIKFEEHDEFETIDGNG